MRHVDLAKCKLRRKTILEVEGVKRVRDQHPITLSTSVITVVNAKYAALFNLYATINMYTRLKVIDKICCNLYEKMLVESLSPPPSSRLYLMHWKTSITALLKHERRTFLFLHPWPTRDLSMIN
jgi:hypothetical protein